MTIATEARPLGTEPVFREVAGIEEWKDILAALGRDVPSAMSPTSPSYRRILVPMMVGASDLFAVREGLLGHALRLRGASVIFLLCDGLTACDARTFDADDPDQCAHCFPLGANNLARLGHTSMSVSSFVSPDRAVRLRERASLCPPEELLSYTHAGIHVGRHVYSSTLRYFRAGRFDANDPAVVARARHYLGSALVMTEAARNAIRHLKPDKIFTSHGMYVSWGPWADTARAMNVACDLYGGGWRRNTLLCQHESESFVHGDDIWDACRDAPLSAAQDEALTDYLAARETNRDDSFRYFDAVDPSVDALFSRLGVAANGFASRACLFGNVAWDAARYGQEGVFGDMFRWAVETARFYRSHPEHLLLIKAHPAETRFIETTPSRWTLAGILEEELGELPPNVKLIGTDDNVSNFELSRVLDLALVHTSSVGFELALLGLPVMTTGAGVHYEKEGIVLRPESTDHYFDELERSLGRKQDFAPDLVAARRYAYTIYFRKSLPFELIDVDGWTPKGLAIDRLGDLAPGAFPGLDALCRGILDGTPLALLEGAHP